MYVMNRQELTNSKRLASNLSAEKLGKIWQNLIKVHHKILRTVEELIFY